MRNADVAMYRAKELGRNNYQYFTLELTQRMASRMALEFRLRLALGNNEFRLNYQPKVDLTSGRVVGLEALLRWQNADLGAVTPDRFIATAWPSGDAVS